MSMMTTINTFLHRDLERDWSSFPFPTVQVACIRDVLWSSRYCMVGLHDRVRVSVVTLFFGSGYVIFPFPALILSHSFHIGLRVSLLVHALSILLVSEVPLHDRSASVLARGIQVTFAHLSFSIASAPLGNFQCSIMSVTDVHDVSTADSLLCLLLDLFGDALQNTTTAAICFAWSLESNKASSALHTILDL